MGRKKKRLSEYIEFEPLKYNFRNTRFTITSYVSIVTVTPYFSSYFNHFRRNFLSVMCEEVLLYKNNLRRLCAVLPSPADDGCYILLRLNDPIRFHYCVHFSFLNRVRSKLINRQILPGKTICRFRVIFRRFKSSACPLKNGNKFDSDRPEKLTLAVKFNLPACLPARLECPDLPAPPNNPLPKRSIWYTADEAK